MAPDLFTLAEDLRNLANAIRDPASGPPALQSALAAVRTLTATEGRPGPPAPNLDLLAPFDGVPLPRVRQEVGPGDPVGPDMLAVALPLPTPGPTGPAGDTGPVGPPGPPGPGVDPARIALLEAAILDLQEHQLIVEIIGQ